MRLFVYSPLSASARAYLQQQLPADVDSHFRPRPQPSDHNPPPSRTPRCCWATRPRPGWRPACPSLRFWQIDSAGFERYRHLHAGRAGGQHGRLFCLALRRNHGGRPAGPLPPPGRAGRAAEPSNNGWAAPTCATAPACCAASAWWCWGPGPLRLAVRQQLSGFECQVQLLARTAPAGPAALQAKS